MVKKKESMFSDRCDACKKPKKSLKVKTGRYKGQYLCVDCFVDQTDQKETHDPHVVYISVSGGVISIDKKPKGVKIIIREYDEERSLKIKSPYLIIHDADKVIDCGDEFFKVS